MMTTGVDLSDLSIDVEGWVREQADAERVLLKLAQEERPEKGDLDYLAATELLVMYLDRDPFYAPEVLAAIEAGARNIMRDALDSRVHVSPLTYFGRGGKGGRGNRANQVNRARLRLRKEIGLLLTAGDAEAALTMERGEGRGRGKKVSRIEWAETIGEVEIALIEYVLARFLNKSAAASEGGEVGADDETREHKPDRQKLASEDEVELARAYVRDSFASYPWHKPETAITDWPSGW